MADEKTTKVVALFDTVGYHNAAGDTLYADKGDEFEMLDTELDRHLDLGSVARASSKDAKAAKAEADAETPA